MKLVCVGFAASIALFAMGCSPSLDKGAKSPTASAAGPTTEAVPASTTTITNATLPGEPPKLIIPYVQWDDYEDTAEEEPSSSLQTWGVPEAPYTGPVGKYGF